MEEGRLPVRRVMVVRPRLMVARLLFVIAAILGLLAMHSITQMDAAAAADGHPVATAVAGSVHEATDSISSESEHGGCCATTCEAMAAICAAPPRVMKFTAVGIEADAVAQSVGERPPAAWWAATHAPPRRGLGLVITALAVTRI